MIATLTTLLLTTTMMTSGARDSLSTKNYSQLMSPGVNLGNTLEAIPKETSWGNPKPTDAYFKSVRAAGFRSVRIPVAWTQYSDEKYNIKSEWMKHVTDVVNMAIKADLYVMINIHWDGGWLQPTTQKQQMATQKLRKFWEQIATNFKDFDDHLLLAGTNETGVEGQYSMPAAENAEIQNSFNQVFVTTVRASGSKNRNRFLVIQVYNTDIDICMKFNTVMPKDSVKDRLMMEVHYYSPYNFTLNDKSDIWQWGKTASDPKSTDTWGNEDYVDAQFAKMKTQFVEKGIPVILGEYCAGMKGRFPGMDKYRLLWDEYVTASSARHGMVPMLWDTGSIFDRATGKAKDKDLIDRIIGAKRSKN